MHGAHVLERSVTAASTTHPHHTVGAVRSVYPPLLTGRRQHTVLPLCFVKRLREGGRRREEGEGSGREISQAKGDTCVCVCVCVCVCDRQTEGQTEGQTRQER